MRGGTLGLLLGAAACSAQIGNGAQPDATPPDRDADTDDGPRDAPPGLGPWNTPLQIPGASSALDEDDGTLSADTLELFFAAQEPADNNRKHLYTMTRPNAQSMVWSAPERLPFNVTGATDQTPRLSDDQLTMYFASTRPGGVGNLDIYQVSRPTIGGAWGTPALVPAINSPQSEKWWALCAGGRYLLISGRSGVSEDIYEGVLGGGAPVLVGELSTPQSETGTFITGDCLTTYFASTRSGTNQMYTATRSSPTAPWPAPAMIVDFTATGGAQEDPWLAVDQQTFMFCVEIGGNKDIYLTTR